MLFRRDDGFHEIETVITAIDLFDTLYFVAESRKRITLECSWASGLRGRAVSARSTGESDSSLGDVPCGTDNIVLQAVELVARRAGVESGACLRLVKQIPTAAGLGGGSSDAAAALVAANQGWNLGWSPARLAQVGAELGSDVPFFWGRDSRSVADVANGSNRLPAWVGYTLLWCDPRVACQLGRCTGIVDPPRWRSQQRG